MRVKDLNATKGDIKTLRNKICADLKSLGALCALMGDEVNRRYYEEINRAEGKTEGLGDFEVVRRLLRRDVQATNGALGVVSKVRGAEGYDFDEMTESEEATKSAVKGK